MSVPHPRRIDLPLRITVAVVLVVMGVGAYVALSPGSGLLAKKSAVKSATAAKSVARPVEAPTTPPGVPVAGERAIAVLPFADRSDDASAHAYFADGVHEDILNNLSLIRDFRVISRRTMMQYRETTKSVRDIGGELGVAYVVEGSVRRMGDKVLVAAQLLSTRDGEPVWLKDYEAPLGEIFAIESAVAQEIAATLRTPVSPEEKRLLDRRPTRSLDAYELFVLARQERNGSRRTSALLQKWEDWLQQAVSLDPNFAAAWAALSWTHGYRYIFSFDHTEQRRELAKTAIDHAVRLAPDSPEVMLDLGYYHYFCQRDYARASTLFDILVQQWPNVAEPRYALANIQRRQGKWAEAIANYRAVTRTDPYNLDYSQQYAFAALGARRFDEALAEQQRRAQVSPAELGERYRLALVTFLATGSGREMETLFSTLPAPQAALPEVIQYRQNWAHLNGNHARVLLLDRLQPANSTAGRLMVALSLLATGESAEARARLAPELAQARTVLAREPGNELQWSVLGCLEALSGNPEEARRCAQKALELMPASTDAYVNWVLRSNHAFVLAWTGDKEAALAEYAQLLRMPNSTYPGFFSHGDPASMVNVHVMKQHPAFLPLRSEARFEAMLSEPKNHEPLF